MIILGISAYFHDSSAALIVDGKVVAAAQEERFSRKKHDNSFPSLACKYCLSEGKVSIEEVDYIAFFEKPFLKFERILEMAINYAPKGFRFFSKAMPIWLKDKLNMRKLLQREIKDAFNIKAVNNIRFIEHHVAHSSLAYYTSPFKDAAILTIDAVGEWATTSFMKGEGNKITLIKEQHYPNSIGLLYSSATYFLGFRVNSDEYKVMGLAPYGKKDSPETKRFVDIINQKLLMKGKDGSIILNDKFFTYSYRLKMIDISKWEKLFSLKSRASKDKFTQSHCNFALAFQLVLEQIALSLALNLKEEFGSKNLCISGGTALNCAMNGFLKGKKIFDNIFVPYSPGDGGSSIGAALAVYYLANQERIVNSSPYIGPDFSNDGIKSVLDSRNINYLFVKDQQDLYDKVTDYIINGKIIGWFQGKMEFGPRALGNRSILADPRDPDMKHKVNSKIKFREEFRPFAPAVLSEDKELYFDMDFDSPYMMFTTKVKEVLCNDISDDLLLDDIVNANTSIIPAVTHIDRTARVQTVSAEDNKKFHDLLLRFKSKTGCSLLLNTSFNVMGEPIVCTPDDALNTFFNSGIDVLVIENFIILKQ
jgi:carbamoyltransferase